MQIYRVRHSDDCTPVVFLPPELSSALNMPKSSPLNLKFGSLSCSVFTADTTESPAKEKDIIIPPLVAQKMQIPNNIKIMAKPTGRKGLRLGPLIGVLTFSAHIPYRLGYYTKYATTRNTGCVYVFAGRDINPKTRTIKGYRFDCDEGKWKPGEFPFPDAVIDRRYPSSRKHHAALEKVIGPNRIFNNKTLITKTEFVNALNDDKFLRKFIPETRLLTGGRDLTALLDKYGRVYLKPVSAMKGSGIIVATLKKQGIECSYRIGSTPMTTIITEPDHIFKIAKDCAGKRRQYIIQQAVDSIQYQGGPVSFRTCPQKDGNNRWIMMGVLVLGSLGRCLVTNYSAGGQCIPLHNLFAAISLQLPYDKKELLAILEDLTLKTSAALDRKYGPLGELGIDILVDKSGKPWLLEANGNPGRIAAFLQTEFPEWPLKMYDYLMAYTYYLAGFTG